MREGGLVVDDDKSFRVLARTVLERAGYGVVEAANADEALAAVDLVPPQLVLLDVCLPQVSGYELSRELRDRLGDDVPIIFVSGERTDSYDRIAGLLLGADDYLVKPFEPDELIARIRRSLRAHANGKAAQLQTDTVAALTQREREVLVLLASGRSSVQIADELVISPRTVGTHIQHILVKLGVENRTQAAAEAYRLGIVEPDVAAHLLGAETEPRTMRLAS